MMYFLFIGYSHLTCNTEIPRLRYISTIIELLILWKIRYTKNLKIVLKYLDKTST